MHFNSEVKLSDLLTILSVLVAATALFISWVRDRSLRRREYADRVRSTAALASVAAARRREISLWMYDAIQPALTEADQRLVATGDDVKTRDELWKLLVTTRAEIQKRLLDEKIEEAYVGLYGYDTGVRQRYQRTMAALGDIDDNGYGLLLKKTQEVVRNIGKASGQLRSADLGNPLRQACYEIQVTIAARMQSVVDDFQATMASLITESDRDIFRKVVLALKDGRPTDRFSGRGDRAAER